MSTCDENHRTHFMKIDGIPRVCWLTVQSPVIFALVSPHRCSSDPTCCCSQLSWWRVLYVLVVKHMCKQIYKLYVYIYIYYILYIYIIHTYIHTCMHACMHTYIHTYIHYTYIWVSIFSVVLDMYWWKVALLRSIPPKHTPKHSPEAYPEANPQNEDHFWGLVDGCCLEIMGRDAWLHAAFRRPLPQPALHPRSLAAMCRQVGWRQLRCWLAAVASLWQLIPFASTSFWCWLAVVAPV